MKYQESGACSQEAFVNVTQQRAQVRIQHACLEHILLSLHPFASANALALTVGASVFRLGFRCASECVYCNI